MKNNFIYLFFTNMKKFLWLLPIGMLLFGISYAAPSAYPDKALEHFNLLNIYRSNNDVWQLEWNANLAKCAEDYLYQQIYNNFQWHYGQDWRSTPTARCKWAKMWAVWENLIASTNYFPSPDRALELRDSSKLHKKNMLMTWYWYVWVAAVWDPVKKQARRAQVFAFKKTPSLSTNIQTTWNVSQTTVNVTTPKLLYRSIENASIVQRWEKQLLRLPVILEWEIDRWKAWEMSRSILTTLANFFDQM